ncbi:MAG: S41 family peptidase [Nitrospira sp.]|nr:S41 family peptidase [Candidatus Manganitrophaceae bacterium]HIL34561.1 S41 family peptidase [Candidatus Manganitrophaceae bacterium]
MKFKERVGTTLLFMAIIGIFGVSFMAGKGLETNVSAETDDYEELKVFTEVLSALQRNYVEPIDNKELIYGAIKGMLNTLDAHSTFMPPTIYKEMQVDTRGEFGGLGLQIGIKENRLVVVAPIEGTPADVAGIKAGDIILKVDDYEFTKETTLLDAVSRMRGPKGTEVVLTIERDTKPDPLIFPLIRAVILIKSVKSKVLEPGIGYIRITQFQEKTSNDLRTAISKLKEANIHSLILDLRNNPGGLLNSAVDVSEQFLDSGKIIVSIKSRDGRKDEYKSSRTNSIGEMPLIILVNEGSASASEIVSGALQDWKRAVILGTPTFGKGSVQTILPLSDGSALRLTTAKYYTPKGRSIQNRGIDPDIVVVPAEISEIKDRQIIREKDLERHLESESQPEEPVLIPPAEKTSGSDLRIEQEDQQLKKAVDLLKSWKIFKGIDSRLSVKK